MHAFFSSFQQVEARRSRLTGLRKYSPTALGNLEVQGGVRGEEVLPHHIHCPKDN